MSPVPESLAGYGVGRKSGNKMRIRQEWRAMDPRGPIQNDTQPFCFVRKRDRTVVQHRCDSLEDRPYGGGGIELGLSFYIVL